MSNDNVLHSREDVDFAVSGWDSIEAKLSTLYPDVEPLHYGTIIRRAMGGPDPLDGVSIYRNPGPPAHWHYVSYGLTELYEKESDSQEFSGYGFEFTFRLAIEEGNPEEPPTWPVGLMQNLARYVFQTGNVFDYGHRIPLNSPILKGSNTLLCGAMFAVDPQLGVNNSPNGQYQFLQIIGTTGDELDAAESWNTKKFIELLARKNELMVTTLSRDSVLNDPEIAALVNEGSGKDGSTCGTLYVGDSEIVSDPGGSEVTFKVPRKDVASLRRLIAGRLLHGRKLTLVSPDSSITLVPGDDCRLYREEDGFAIDLSESLVKTVLEALDSGEKYCRFAELRNFAVSVKDNAVQQELPVGQPQ